MLRQYRQFFEKIFLALLYIRFRKSSQPRDVVQYAIDSWHHSVPGMLPFEGMEKVQQCARQVLENSDGLGEGSYEELLVELADQLNDDSTKSFKDGSLIDRIVRTLGLPYARNHLNSRILADLRKALLLPDEMAQLGERLEQKEMRCAGCTRQFVSNEMTTVMRDGHDTLIYCMKCHKPTYIACSKCDERIVSIDKKVHKILEQPWDCGCHDGTVKPAEQPGSGNSMAPAGGQRISADDARIRFSAPDTLLAATAARNPFSQLSQQRYVTWAEPTPPASTAHIDGIGTFTHTTPSIPMNPTLRASRWDSDDGDSDGNEPDLEAEEPDNPVDPPPFSGESYTQYVQRIARENPNIHQLPTFVGEDANTAVDAAQRQRQEPEQVPEAVDALGDFVRAVAARTRGPR